MQEKVLTVLVVDDTDAQRYAVRRTLEAAGFRVQEAQDGEQALQTAVSQPDLILLDVKLPGMDGFEVCRRLKANPETAHICVLQTSAHFTLQEHKVRGMEGGADDYIVQPISKEELIARLKVWGRVRRAEAELREKERRQQAAFDHAGVGITEADPEERLVAVNPRACDILGYRADELLGMTVGELTAPEYRPRSDHLYVRLRAGEFDRFENEKQYLRRDGSRVWVHVTVSAIRDAEGRFVRAIGTIEDISRRKRAEQQLQLHAAALESAANAILITARDGTIQWANPGFTKLTGYTLEEVRGQNPRVLKSGTQDAQFYRSMWETILAGAVWSGEVTNRRKDGSVYVENMTITPVRNADGAVSQFVAIKEDITARKQAETRIQELNASLQQRNIELEAERARWQGVVEGIADEVWVCDAEGKMSLINLPDVTHMGLEAFENKSVQQVYEEVDILYVDGRVRPPEEAPLLRSLRGEVCRGEEMMRHRVTGKTRYRQFSSAPVRDAAGHINGAVAIVRDITEHKQAQEALLRTEKLASLGRMAATIAHEINNPLSAVTNLLYLIAADASLSEQAQRRLQAAEDELKRVAHITRQTLGIYREQHGVAEVSIAGLVEEVLSIFRRKLRSKSVCVVTDYGDGPDQVVALAGEIRQVISNLVANSIDAVAEEGTVKIRVRPAMLRRYGGTPGLRITIADSGSGIPPEQRARIFDPFFTTKQALGNGLGLWISREIVHRHSGTIQVRSRMGVGTTFSVLLPCDGHAQRRAANSVA